MKIRAKDGNLYEMNADGTGGALVPKVVKSARKSSRMVKINNFFQIPHFPITRLFSLISTK